MEGRHSDSDTGSISSGQSDFSDSCSYRFLKYEFVAGYQIKSKLLYTIDEKQFYYFNKSNKSGDAYLCIEKKCNSRLNMRKDEMCIQQEKYSAHIG